MMMMLVPNHIMGDPACSNTETTIDLNSLVNSIHSACQLETHYPELTDAELEKLHPYLGWKPLEVIRKTLENTICLTKLENRLPMI